MLACVDVDYRADGAVAACLLFRGWSDERELACLRERVSRPEPYEPGRFYLRELPCLLRVLRRVEVPPRVVVIDGYVWLAGEDRPGLGGHLHRALGGRVAVVGVAKSAFRGCAAAAQVLRGRSKRPLYVTAVGVELDEAAARIREMHGRYRIPTLLRRVDQACRQRKR